MSAHTVTKILVTEYRAQMRAQGVSSPGNIAFVCPVCGTVQSIRSLLAAGVEEEKVDRYIGFSCEGRWRNSGACQAPVRDREERVGDLEVRGCDWTLGGLFSLHEVVVVTPKGSSQPSFRLASREAAAKLEDWCDEKQLPVTRTWEELEQEDEQ